MKGLTISNKEYRAREGVSSTDLKKIAKSPAHFRYWKDNPEESTQRCFSAEQYINMY